MDYTEIKSLFNYLDDNKKQLNPLQSEFITSLRQQFKWTGTLTSNQLDSLVGIKEKISSVPDNLVIEPDYSGLYSQLQEIA